VNEGGPVDGGPGGVRPFFSNRPISFAGRQVEAPEPWFPDLKIFRRVFPHAGGPAGMTMAA